MSCYKPGKFIKGRWVFQDFDKYPMHLGYHLGYPSEDEVKPTLSWRIAEAWKVFRGKPTLQERMTAEAPKMYELLSKCYVSANNGTGLSEQLKAEIYATLRKIKRIDSYDAVYESVVEKIKKNKLGDLIYPSNLGTDRDLILVYRVLEEFKAQGYLSTVYEAHCHNCGNSKGVILNSLLQLPEDFRCASCGQRLNIADDLIVIYKVVKRPRLE